MGWAKILEPVLDCPLWFFLHCETNGKIVLSSEGDLGRSWTKVSGSFRINAILTTRVNVKYYWIGYLDKNLLISYLLVNIIPMGCMSKNYFQESSDSRLHRSIHGEEGQVETWLEDRTFTNTLSWQKWTYTWVVFLKIIDII